GDRNNHRSVARSSKRRFFSILFQNAPRERTAMNEANLIMSPNHPRWAEFVGKLDAIIFVAKSGERPTHEDPKVVKLHSDIPKVENRCTHDHHFSQVMMREMGIDGLVIDETLLSFGDQGAHCNCEVLMN